MKTGYLLMASVCFSSLMYANDSIGSEFSHFAGGAVMAGGITAVVDRYYPEHQSERAEVGFLISSAVITVEQGIEWALNGNAKGQLLDIASHVAGSALGAYVTDQYILSPVIEKSASEGNFIGLQMACKF